MLAALRRVQASQGSPEPLSGYEAGEILVAAGWACFPVPAGFKFDHGLSYLSATTSPAEWRELVTQLQARDRYMTDVNVAVCPFRCAVPMTVLDFDSAVGLFDFANEWHDQTGAGPDTLRIASPSGNEHLWFVNDEPLANGFHPWGGETRSANGHVLLPPSWADGGSYQALNFNRPVRVDDVPWVLRGGRRRADERERARLTHSDVDVQLSKLSVRGWAPGGREMLGAIIEKMCRVGHPGRNPAMAAAVNEMLDVSLMGMIPAREGLEILGEAYAHHVSDTRDQEASLGEVARMSKVWVERHPQLDAEIGAMAWAQGTSVSVPTPGEVVIPRPPDPFGAAEARLVTEPPAVVPEVVQEPSQPPPEAPVPEPPRTRIKSGMAVLDSPTIPWLVKGRIHQSGFGQFYAPPYQGKTLVALSLALAVANGHKEWFGQDLHRSGDVLYVAMEGGPSFQVHVDAWIKRHAGVLDHFHVLDEEEVNLADSDSIVRFMQDIELAGIKPVLVVFDTQIDVIPTVNEDKNAEVVPVLKSIRTWAKKHDLFALLVHHTPHDLERPRGASGMGGAFDMHALASVDTGLKWTKVKGGAKPEKPEQFLIETVPGSEGAVVHFEDELFVRAAKRVAEEAKLAPVKDEILKILGYKSGPDLTSGELEKKVGVAKEAYLAAMRSLKDDGRIEQFKIGRATHHRIVSV